MLLVCGWQGLVASFCAGFLPELSRPVSSIPSFTTIEIHFAGGLHGDESRPN